MSVKRINISKKQVLKIEQFKELDYFAVEKYDLPIELMMENAGLQLANLVATHASKQAIIRIGVGNGNNGGGGLVAARRLAAWGYQVHLDIWGKIEKPLPVKQLERARVFGVKEERTVDPDVWVDAYLGFSQRFPLPEDLLLIIKEAGKFEGLKISLDLPVGFQTKSSAKMFDADFILTLAAPKKELNKLRKARIFVADLGIPAAVYEEFDKDILPFETSNILEINRSVYAHEHVKKMGELHSETFEFLKGGSIVKFLKSYASDLREGFLSQVEIVGVQLSNYYKPLIGMSNKEIFRFDLSKSDFNNAAAAIHGFQTIDRVRDVNIDYEFERAVDMLLAGDYYGLRKKLTLKPELAHQHSQFGHKAQLIHYCASNAVEMYRQVVPDNLREMILLLIEFGADPSVKIPVYGGQFDFFELFETSAHPKEAKVVKEIHQLFGSRK